MSRLVFLHAKFADAVWYYRHRNPDDMQSQQQLATQVGVSTRAICIYEQGGKPELLVFMRLCASMQVDPTKFFVEKALAPPKSEQIIRHPRCVYKRGRKKRVKAV
jgi:DNA-binding XRE family transcriptional regulator